jgi:N-acetylglutamate synthase-like GNAT family acetyltransferase
VSERVRRARLQDLGGIVRLMAGVSRPKGPVSEAEVTEWFYGKGVWVATREHALVGVAAWQAENLLAVTDVFHVEPAEYWPEAGDKLLKTIEGEAQILMCEANVVLLSSLAAEEAQSLLQQRGYERRTRDTLHRIWQEVLEDLIGDEPEVMVKKLRDRMVMAPV